MPKIKYISKRFNKSSIEVIQRANTIINDYARQGYDLTLRQLYYQFVSRNWLTNNDKSYKKLGGIISGARRSGLIDWNRIVDRTRYVRTPPSWEDPSSIVGVCAKQFDVDWWENQQYRPEVYVEKDALVGVLEVACEPWHCPYFSCRGYTSDSEAWQASQRMMKWIDKGQIPVIFHLGDHDPSGKDMSRDIEERLNLFNTKVDGIVVKRIALTMTQVEEVNPPPNPAKITDTRFAKYQQEFGDESWELDALNPEYITNLIAGHMEQLIDKDVWAESERKRDEGRRLLTAVSDDWERITGNL